MKFTLAVLLMTASGALLFSSCSNKQQNLPPDSEYNHWVRSFTSGIIKSNQAVEVQFIDLDDVQNVDLDGLISMVPHIEGRLRWISRRTVSFLPSEVWSAGQTYQATIHLDQFSQLEGNEEDFKFSFDIEKRWAKFENILFHQQTQDGEKRNEIRGVLVLSEVINQEEVEKCLSIIDDKSQHKIKWFHEKDGLRHSFTITNVFRHDHAYDVQLLFKGKSINVKHTLSQLVAIPAAGSFLYMDHSVKQGSKQEIVINFSDLLLPNQELEGLIQLNNTSVTNYLIQGKRLTLYPDRRLIGDVVVKIMDQIKNNKQHLLRKSASFTVNFVNISPQVQLLKKGVVVPRSDGLKFPFKAVNIRAVRVQIIHIYEDNVSFFLQENGLGGIRQMKRAGRMIYNDIVHLKTSKVVDFTVWNNYSINLENYIDIEPGAIYRVILSLDKAYSLYPCKRKFPEQGTATQHASWDKEINESDRNLYSNYESRYYYYGNNNPQHPSGDPCKSGYFNWHNTYVAQSIIASDLGIIAKKGEQNRLHVVVSDLRDAVGKSGVKLAAYSFQHTLVGAGYTDKEGMAILELAGKPYLLVATNGEDHSYLRLEEGSTESVSMFEVGGEKNKSKLNGFLYADRGVWRPGDSIYLQFIIRDKAVALPKGHPINIRCVNAKGQEVFNRTKVYTGKPIVDLRFATQSEDPTGVWHVRVNIANHYFNKSLRIETVKPNRLKMNIENDENRIPLQASLVTTTLESHWLHGAVASNLKADVKMKLKSGDTQFKNHEGYRFDDVVKHFTNVEKEIFNGRLDSNGRTALKAEINTRTIPGMLQAQFTTRVYEEGGEFSIDRQLLKISPFDSYVGLKVSRGSGWKGAYMDSDDKLATIARLTPEGLPMNGKVEVRIYGMSWNWWYNHHRGGNWSNFINHQKNKLISTEQLEIKNGKGFYSIPELNSHSRYIIIVRDLESGHSASHSLHYYWGAGSKDKESAKMFQFELDKSKYLAEETIEVRLPSNGIGYFIVSLESASEVVKVKRVKAINGTTKVTFPARADLIPNAYIYVAYIQPHAQTANDLPIRMYGVQPVFIEDLTTRLTPSVTTASSWEPNQDVEIAVSEASGQDMQYTIAIVDEGLLQLTRFQTPDPWKVFHRKQALSVQTWDMYDEVVGAHASEMAGLLAIGGDGSQVEVGGVKANRFPPMTRFIGPFLLDKNEQKTHTIHIPNYVGEVRLMIVAATQRAYGHAEKSVSVKTPLMILSSLPRVLGPGETVNVPVTVFAMKDDIKDVHISMEAGDKVKIIKTNEDIRFSSTGDQVVYFPIRVNKLGIEMLKIHATNSKYEAYNEIEFEIRPSNPPVYEMQSKIIEPGATVSISANYTGIEGTNSLALEVSSGIQFNVGRKGKNLFRYPHGCIEQTTSKVFPQLFLTTLMTLTNAQLKKANKNIKAGIKRIYSFQLQNGGLGYWPNATKANTWGTNYAGHFMLEAKAKGYEVPADFIKNWAQYQKTIANNWLPSKYGVNDHGNRWDGQLIQAYRLYTLALAGKPEIGAMNRLRVTSNLNMQAAWRLALGYHLIGRKEVAKSIINKTSWDVKPYTNYGRTYGSVMRDNAMILETMLDMGDLDRAFELADIVCKQWNASTWCSTQTTAYVMLTMSKFIRDLKGKGLQFNYKVDQKIAQSIAIKDNIFNMKLPPSMGMTHRVKFTNTGQDRVYVKIITSGIPLEGNEEFSESNLSMKVDYFDLHDNKIDPTRLKRGTDFVAVVKLKNPGILGHYREMALTQIFPSGWEIHNSRLDLLADSNGTTRPIYQDIRDDRVNTYFNIKRGYTHTYKVRLTALFPGRYYQGSTFCETMYNNYIYALTPGKWVEVIE